MSCVQSFPPLEDGGARLLILGSMPGKESLRAGQYYAHPRNAFWPIMGELAGVEPALPYPARIAALQAAGIALWDVLASCTRTGSLDSAIDAASIVPNDFAAFFSAHPRITQVFFNGALAEKVFQQRVRDTLETRALHYQRLPSTSPANAGMSYAQKLAVWRAILGL